MQHGMGGDGIEFIINEASIAPGFTLLREGYEVWLGNNRGGRYGMNHTTLKVNDARFWEFDFDEMGTYDLPASIDYILNITGQSKLSFVGHSMGGTQMITGLSMDPQYF